MKNQTGGVSFLALCGIIAILFLVVCAIKIFPVYTNYWYVSAAVESLYTEPPGATVSNKDIYRRIARHLQNNAVYSVNPEDVVTISGRGNSRQYSVDYQSEIPLFFNATLVLKFQ